MDALLNEEPASYEAVIDFTIHLLEYRYTNSYIWLQKPIRMYFDFYLLLEGLIYRCYL